MGTKSTWGGRKWPARDPCPLVTWPLGSRRDGEQ